MSGGASYWGKPKAQPVTRSPRCFKCGGPPAPVCYGSAHDLGRNLYACAEHQADARAYWAERFPDLAARLDAIESGALAPLPPSRDVLELTARKAPNRKAPVAEAQGCLLP